ncbi:alpha/beta hydrolase [Afifella sp. IM 167]|nr:alpha/beta hydrolase [Afifella sp. IM 167]
MHVPAQDGLKLGLRFYGEWHAERLPLVCLPGLSRNARDFQRLASFFAGHAEAPRTVVALDYRGRGLSGYDRNWKNYHPLVETADVVTVMTALDIPEAVFIGTSRGGLAAMILGAIRPKLLAGVVLNDIGPKIEGTGLARIKNYLGRMRPPRTWAEAEELVRQINGRTFTGVDDEDWRAFTEAMFVKVDGELKPDFDPNLMKTVQNLDLEDEVPTLWPQFASLAKIPVMSIRGANSDLLSPSVVDEMARRHPSMERLTVPGQGHAPLLRDRPTLNRIAAFARRCDERRAAA